ncbi:MAG: SPOR domain-containing protein [Magnetococcales bacterium]|nr:SPOR domain-containing protein [Magnetococcales bacterium]
MDRRKRWISWLGAGLLCGVAWAGEPVGGDGADPLETGRALSRAGAHARAVEAFTQVLQGKDRGPERRLGALEGRCEALTRQSLLEKRGELALRAVEDCSERLRSESGVARIWRLRGLARLAAGQPEQALINFNHALRLEPDDRLTLRDRGVVLLGLGRLAEAEGDFQRVARLDPDQAWNHFNRGLVLARNGRVAEAAEAWRAFVRVRGEGSREWLAQVVARPGGDPDSRRVFEAMERTEPAGDSPQGRGDPASTAAATASPSATPAATPTATATSSPSPPSSGAAPAASVSVTPAATATASSSSSPAPSPSSSATPSETPAASAAASPASAGTPAPSPAPPSAVAASEGTGKNKLPPGGVAPSATAPTKTTLPASANGYEVRLGSFQDRGNLEATVRSLSRLGLTAREEEVTVGERLFYRLVAGPFADEAEARSVMERAAKLPGVHPEPVRAR